MKALNGASYPSKGFQPYVWALSLRKCGISGSLGSRWVRLQSKGSRQRWEHKQGHSGEGAIVLLEPEVQDTEQRETKQERRELEGLILPAGEAGLLRERPQCILLRVWGCDLCSYSGHTTTWIAFLAGSLCAWQSLTHSLRQTNGLPSPCSLLPPS